MLVGFPDSFLRCFAASCACALFCNSGYGHDWFAVPSSGEKLKRFECSN